LVVASHATARGTANAGVALLPAERQDAFHLCFVGANARPRKTVCQGPTACYSQYEGSPEPKTTDYFVSDAQFVHLGPAARILTEEFYSKRTNFLTFQLERLKTVLSLESTFSNLSRRGEAAEDMGYSGPPLQHMTVACDAKTGEVVGFAEVDARPLGGRTTGAAASAPAEDHASEDIVRSYMYNLAVDKRWKRRGIASALVRRCEEYVADAHDACLEKRLYLRVRKCNRAAIALYEKMGYEEMPPERIALNKEDVNRGSLEDGELILLAKDLPVDAECALE